MLFQHFLDALNAAVTAGWVVLVILVLRPFLRQAPRWIHCALWCVVALRLLLPFEIPSPVSLIPAAEPIGWEYADSGDTILTVDSGIGAVDNMLNPVVAENPINASHSSSRQPYTYLPYVWLAGTGLLLLYAAVQYLRLRRRVATAVRMEGNIYQSEWISSPFILGLFRPRIYLPYGLNEKELSLILAHEQAHIRRLDPITKLLAFLLVSVYWFQPLLWIAYILLCRDMELACDQRAIRDMELPRRQDYSDTLLRHSAKRFGAAACPLAFGEVGVKARIRQVMHYKKPTFWAVLAGATAVAVAAVCLLTAPGRYHIDRSAAAFATQEIQGRKVLTSSVANEHLRTCAVEVFGMEKKESKTTVYAHVMTCDYTLQGVLPSKQSDYTELAVLDLLPTEHIRDDSVAKGWVVTEYGYWTPTGDGAEYANEILKKMPRRLQKKAYCDEKTRQKLQEECDRQVQEQVLRSLTTGEVVSTNPTDSTTGEVVSTNPTDSTTADHSDTSLTPTIGLLYFDATVLSHDADGTLYVQPTQAQNRQQMGERVTIRRFQQTVDVVGLQPGEPVRIAYMGGRYPELHNPMEFDEVYDLKRLTTTGVTHSVEGRYRLSVRTAKQLKRERINTDTEEQALGYNVYTYGLEEPVIWYGDSGLSLGDDVRRNGAKRLAALRTQAEQDATAGTCSVVHYKDGGTVEYRYPDYNLIVMHRILSVGEMQHLNDIYITTPDIRYSQLPDSFFTN